MEFCFTEWRDYFRRNQSAVKELNCKYDQLSETERRVICSSVQQFQIGESSEGLFLIAAAKRFLKDCADKSYLEALILFIQDEQRHAGELEIFMNRHNIPKLEKLWVDQVFRRLRRFASLEQSITVLLTAEIIAAVYYDALKNVTGSVCLRSICGQILIDEEKHIEFQAEALHKFGRRRLKITNTCAVFSRFILLTGTLPVVWLYHRKVLKAGGKHFFVYLKEAYQEYVRAETLINT
ncbi:hypothetical protein [Bacillus velezensis]|uniref:hypothetical protein n=1 Tax=Bacillus velezensis TaxID=492670 RepID=UPI000E26AAAD|nr:hypothetical protein [Bacillus velezensis]QHQ59042.1 hypothetical protein GWK37_18815 [Bacillus velezensis]RDY87150.1 hypothetical protein C3734_02475 [Bacillus velezensis]